MRNIFQSNHELKFLWLLSFDWKECKLFFMLGTIKNKRNEHYDNYQNKS